MKIFLFVICLVSLCIPIYSQQQPSQDNTQPISAEAEQQKKAEQKVMLFNAIMDEDYTHVQQLLNKKAPVNVTDSEGLTPLHYAVCYNQLSIAKLLVNNKANIDARDVEGYTPIYYAAQEGYEDLFNFLLRRGAKLASTEHTTLLHMAAYSGNTNIIKTLLDKKLDTQAKDDKGLLPIDYAASKNLNDAVILLADNTPEESISLNTLLPMIVGENKELLKNILPRIKDKNRLNSDTDSPVRIAAQYSTVDMLQFLEEQGINILYVSPNGCSGLQEAAASGNLDIIKYLIDKGMDINSAKADTGYTSIMTACRANNSDIVKYLTDKGANIFVRSTIGANLIHEAAYRGNLELVSYFKEKGIDINQTDFQGATPLHYALDSNQPGVISWMLQNGADIKQKTTNGDTSLHYAVLSDNDTVFKQVIPSLKGFINTPNNKGITPVLYAAMVGNISIMNGLFAFGAQITDTDADGSTIMHYSVLSNKKEAVEYLCSKIANWNIKNNFGETPLMIAEKNKFTAIKELLTSKLDKIETSANSK